MQTYSIEVRETLSRLVEVKAKDKDEAIEKVRTMYESEEVVLDADDMSGDVEYFDQTDL